jgi:tripeptidyl-peptidase-1
MDASSSSPRSADDEVACQSQLGGVITSGGGFSTYWPQPSWQVDQINEYFSGLTEDPSKGYNSAGRGYPDVSFSGVWYPVVIGGSLYSAFGTSASAPVFAAFLSLINIERLQAGNSSVGFINPTLYATQNMVCNTQFYGTA